MLHRAYLDPALRLAASYNGRWDKPLEIVTAKGLVKKRLYVYNSSSTQVVGHLVAPAITRFALDLPETIRLQPGITILEVSAAPGGRTAPYVEDLTIEYLGEARPPGGGYTEHEYSDAAYSGVSETGSSAVLRFDMSLFCLPAGDERFAGLGYTHLATPEAFRDYIASGMGFVDQDYRDSIVAFMADMLYDRALWAVNKHYLFDPLVAPLRFASAHADSFGYSPPGLGLADPADRRNLLHNAFNVLRHLGSADGFRQAFAALGVRTQEMIVERDNDLALWTISLPRYAMVRYNLNYLQAFALYHCDAYSNVQVQEAPEDNFGAYSDIAYTHESTQGP